MKKILLAVLAVGLLACAGNLPPIDTGQLICLATCKGGTCEKKDGVWLCTITTPVTCPETCPAGQECVDPKVGCVAIAPPPPTCADLACEYGCTENPSTCKPKPPATTCEPACKANEKCVERGVPEKVYECVVVPGPAEAPLIPDEELTVLPESATGASQTWAETNAAIKRHQALHPEKWTDKSGLQCLSSGPAGIDDAFLGISTELLRQKIVAGQSIAQGGQRSDCIFVNRTGGNLYEEIHAFDYKRACVATTSGAYKRLYQRSTGTTEPPEPIPTACPYTPCPIKTWTAETLPPGWGANEIGMAAWKFNAKVHTMGNADSTPVTIQQEPFCASIGLSPMGDGKLRASCPVRPDGHSERVAVEDWLLDGGPVRDSLNGQDCTPNNTDNPYAFLAGTGNCRICNTLKTTCSGWF